MSAYTIPLHGKSIALSTRVAFQLLHTRYPEWTAADFAKELAISPDRVRQLSQLLRLPLTPMPMGRGRGPTTKTLTAVTAALRVLRGPHAVTSQRRLRRALGVSKYTMTQVMEQLHELVPDLVTGLSSRAPQAAASVPVAHVASASGTVRPTAPTDTNYRRVREVLQADAITPMSTLARRHGMDPNRFIAAVHQLEKRDQRSYRDGRQRGEAFLRVTSQRA